MSAPVDVRGVLRREIERAGGDAYEAGRDLIAVDSALAELIGTSDRLGSWMSAALDDVLACDEFKADASAFLTALARVQGGAA